MSVDTLLDRIGRRLARLLTAEKSGYEPYTPSDPLTLRRTLEPADVLLVEGNQLVSKTIQYLTQSTWSHAAIYVGPIPGRREPDGEPHVLVEVVLGDGCISAPLSRYTSYNTRVCRPIGLTHDDRERVCRFMVDRLGLRYDLGNIFDMLRFFAPLPLPSRFRRRALAFGSGDPTRAICSTLIAEAFQSLPYPILPRVRRAGRPERAVAASRHDIYVIRHHSLYAPRDFDLSPYFAVVKPTIAKGFDYRKIVWGEDEPSAPTVEPAVR